MKNLVWLLPVCLLAAGCVGGKSKKPLIVNTAPPPKSSGDKSVAVPVVSSLGKVLSVSSEGRYVILLFPIGTVPPVGQKLEVYRQGLKVGEVRVSGPQNEVNTPADVTSGDVRIGDETRGI